MNKKQYKINEDDSGTRLDIYLAKCIENLTRSQVQRLIDENEILVNEVAVKANYKIKGSDLITCNIPEPEPLFVIAEDIPLDIVYEDGDLVVVNKSQNMVVHPAHGNYTGTLVNAILYHCHDLSGINGVLRPGIVHRIDKDTSGLLVIAKNDFAHQVLAGQFNEHSVKREYLALVEGIVTEPGGIIDAPIGRDLKERQKMAVVTKNSKHALTKYWVLERLQNHTLIKCCLETGRTHQIRVHMNYINHPLVGDNKYGHRKSQLGLNGQALHAGVLGFIHPRTQKFLEFSARPPENFINVLKSLGSEFLNKE